MKISRSWNGLGIVAAFCLLFPFTGCAPTASIYAKKAESYTIEPQRLFVVEDIGTRLGRYSQSFGTAFESAMQGCGVNAEIYVRQPSNKEFLSFEEGGSD